MKVIKDSKSKKEVNSYLTGDGGDIVTMMEKEWPETVSYTHLTLPTTLSV